MRPFPLCACVGAVVAPGAGEVVPWPAVGREPGAVDDPVPVLPAVPDVPLVAGAPVEGAAVEPLEGDDGLVDV